MNGRSHQSNCDLVRYLDRSIKNKDFVLRFDTILRAFYLREGMLELYHLQNHQVKCGMMGDG